MPSVFYALETFDGKKWRRVRYFTETEINTCKTDPVKQEIEAIRALYRKYNEKPPEFKLVKMEYSKDKTITVSTVDIGTKQ